MNNKNEAADWFFNKENKWKAEYIKLRNIVLATGLSEELKWGCPCYTYQNKNVVLIHGFKDYCALLFMKGALLNDPQNILIQQTENVQAARQIRFLNLAEINSLEANINNYILNAIEIEKAGTKVELKKPVDFKMAFEFEAALKEIPELKTSFYNLTPGRQRAYLLHFSTAKLAKTREARIEKCIPQIIAGKGLED